MLIKRFLFLIILLTGSAAVNAQIHGLNVTDLAESPGKGSIHVVGGAFEAETSSLYGGRIAYGLSDRLLVFTDIGVHDADYFDPEFLGQAGMRYTLPLRLPFDLAVRATTIPYISSYEHYVEFTLSLLASKYLDSNSNWAIYRNVGIDRQWWELTVPFDAVTATLYGQDSYTDKGNRSDLSVLLGLSRKLSGTSRFFLEVADIDERYGCAGIRLEL